MTQTKETIQGFETRESLSLRFPGNTLETPLLTPLSGKRSKTLPTGVFGTSRPRGWGLFCTSRWLFCTSRFSWGVIASFARVYTSSSAPQCERLPSSLNSPDSGIVLFYADCGFFDGKNRVFCRIGSKPFLRRILKPGEKARCRNVIEPFSVKK